MDFNWRKLLKAFIEAFISMIAVFINIIPLAFILSNKISPWFSLIYIATIPVAWAIYTRDDESP